MSDLAINYNIPNFPQYNYNNGLSMNGAYPYYNNFQQGYYTPSFTANPTATNSYPNTKQLNNDTVNISSKKEIEKKQGLSKGAKWALGITGAVVATIAALTIHSKIKCSQLEKLYKEKLVMKNLGEHLDFKAATTLEEAMKFTTEKLGIKEIDKEFTLDALNYVNEHLVTVSNKHKGKLYMPTALRFRDMDGALAGVNQDINSKKFCEFTINKKYFDDKFLTKKIKEILGKTFDEEGKNILTGEKCKRECSNYIANLGEDYWNLVDRFKKDASSLSIAEKRKLFYTKSKGIDSAFCEQTSDKIAMLEKIKKTLTEKGKTFNIDKEAFEKLSYKEQTQKIEKILKDNNIKYEVNVVTTDGRKTVYHELKHLQDFGKNLKDLDIKNKSLIQEFKDIWNLKTKDKPIDYVGNRWGGLTYKGFPELFKKNPEEFKLRYPDLYEHLTNEEIKKTAGKVSSYAQTSIGEFIADTGAKMINGETIPDDVMALYKKYNGPLLPT